MKLKYFNRLIYFTGVVTLLNYSKDLPLFLKNIYSTTLKTNQLSALHEKYGNGWVVLTGGTSGIGLSFAHQLSKAGYNICLISRDKEKLSSTCLDLELNYGVKTKYIQYNFANSHDENSVNQLKQKIEDTIGKDNVSILVNNVGIQYDSDFFFKYLKANELINYVSVNILSQLIMYHLLLEKMKSQNGKSLIIDVASSTTVSNVIPTNVVYQSTKTFNSRFSDLIQRQLFVDSIMNNTQNNVDVALFNPGLTITNLTERHKIKTFMSEEADRVVLAGLTDIVNGKFVTAGALKHKTINIFMRSLPEYLKLNYVGPSIVRGFETLRNMPEK
jgi:short-subunit dehydrogenase